MHRAAIRVRRLTCGSRLSGLQDGLAAVVVVLAAADGPAVGDIRAAVGSTVVAADPTAVAAAEVTGAKSLEWQHTAALVEASQLELPFVFFKPCSMNTCSMNKRETELLNFVRPRSSLSSRAIFY